MKKWIFIISILASLLALSIYFYIASINNPEGTRISKLRDDSANEVRIFFNQIEGGASLESFGESYADRCYAGQHNYKVNDPFNSQCGLVITRFYGFNDPQEDLPSFETSLFQLGWQDYRDYYDGPKNLKPKFFPNQYPASNTPKLSIEFAEKSTDDLFSIYYSQYDIWGSTLFTTYEYKNLSDIKEVFRKVTSKNKYILAVSIQKIYFEK